MSKLTVFDFGGYFLCTFKLNICDSKIFTVMNYIVYVFVACIRINAF